MKKILIIFLLIFVFGCAKKYVTTPTEPVRPAETIKEEATKPDVEIKREVVEEVVVPTEKEVKEEIIRESAIPLTKEEASVFKDVLFDFDKYNVRHDARPILDAIASYLKNGRINIVIEGHCDERGTNEYNLALGERRAKSVRDYLSSLGVSQARMSFVTYGEEKPLCNEQNEDCWQKNRRAHFVVSK